MRISAILIMAIMFSSCATISPSPITPQQASFDSGDATSGFLAETPDHKGFVVSAKTRDSYNALIAKYGYHFTPSIQPDEGVSPDGKFFYMTNDAAANRAILLIYARQDALKGAK